MHLSAAEGRRCGHGDGVLSVVVFFFFGRPGSLRSPSGYTLYFASLVLASIPAATGRIFHPRHSRSQYRYAKIFPHFSEINIYSAKFFNFLHSIFRFFVFLQPKNSYISMGKKEKLIQRLLTQPKDFTYSELSSLLFNLGLLRITKGKHRGQECDFFMWNANCNI